MTTAVVAMAPDSEAGPLTQEDLLQQERLKQQKEARQQAAAIKFFERQRKRDELISKWLLERQAANENGKTETPEQRLLRLCRWSIQDQESEFSGCLMAAMNELDRMILEAKIARYFYDRSEGQDAIRKICETLRIATTYRSKNSLIKMGRHLGILPPLAKNLPPVWWQVLAIETIQKRKTKRTVTAHALNARQLGPLGSAEDAWAQFDITSQQGIKTACGKHLIPLTMPNEANTSLELSLSNTEAIRLDLPDVKYCGTCLKKFKRF